MNAKVTNHPAVAPLSPNVAELFRLYAEDAGNWSGTPLLGGNVGLLGDKEDRGLLAHLKRAGLVTTDLDDGNVWIAFTEAGVRRATALGIFLQVGRRVSDPTYNDAVEENDALLAENRETSSVICTRCGRHSTPSHPVTECFVRPPVDADDHDPKMMHFVCAMEAAKELAR